MTFGSPRCPGMATGVGYASPSPPKEQDHPNASFPEPLRQLVELPQDPSPNASALHYRPTDVIVSSRPHKVDEIFHCRATKINPSPSSLRRLLVVASSKIRNPAVSPCHTRKGPKSPASVRTTGGLTRRSPPQRSARRRPGSRSPLGERGHPDSLLPAPHLPQFVWL